MKPPESLNPEGNLAENWRRLLLCFQVFLEAGLYWRETEKVKPLLCSACWEGQEAEKQDYQKQIKFLINFRRSWQRSI